MTVISEAEFAARLRSILPANDNVGAVTGPGRSGAVAAVYASHMLGVPFIPYGQKSPKHLGRLLIVDTARQSGRTLRKAERRYQESTPLVVVAYEEPPRVVFWYEVEQERNAA